jgi:hypothetical protein
MGKIKNRLSPAALPPTEKFREISRNWYPSPDDVGSNFGRFSPKRVKISENLYGSRKISGDSPEIVANLPMKRC